MYQHPTGNYRRSCMYCVIACSLCLAAIAVYGAAPKKTSVPARPDISAQLDEASVAVRAKYKDVADLKHTEPYFGLDGQCCALSLQFAFAAREATLAIIYDLGPDRHGITAAWEGAPMECDADMLARARESVRERFGIDVALPAWIYWTGDVTQTWAIYENDQSRIACNLSDFRALTYEQFVAQAALLSVRKPALSVPAAPTGFTASDGAYADKVVLTWAPVSGATLYKIYRSTTNSIYTAAQIGTDSAPPYENRTCAAGITYYYWVKASNSAGDSGFSISNSGYRALVTPNAPTGLTASDGIYTDKVVVNWQPVSGATLYKVYRGTTSNVSDAVQIGTDSAPPFENKTGTPGMSYYYRVKACNYAGDSWFSNGDYGYRKPVVPSAPASVNATDGTYADKVVVSWPAVTGATLYKIYRGTTSNSGDAVQIGTDSASPFENKTGTAGKTYYYWVKACNGAGDSGFSNGNSGYRKLTTLAAPTNVSASDGAYADKVVVNWSSVSGATGYKIYRATTGNSADAIEIGTDTSSPYEDKTGSAGKTYTYWVTATNGSGQGGFSAGNSGYRISFTGTWTIDGHIDADADGYDYTEQIDDETVRVYSDKTFEDSWGSGGTWSSSGSTITLRYSSTYFEDIAWEWFGFDLDVISSSSNHLTFTGKIDGNAITGGTIDGYLKAEYYGDTYTIDIGGSWHADR
ncbi:hypothetical protein LLG95_18165 [bacterium]|nr:hypothetical protein [bacterium]